MFESSAPVLVVDPPDAEAVTALNGKDVEFWIRHHGVGRAARAMAQVRPVHRGAWADIPSDRFARAVIFLPKGRRLQHMTFARVRALLKPQDRVYVVGANQSGIRGASRILRERVGPTQVIDSARRCVLLRASCERRDSTFDPGAWLSAWTATVADHALEVRSYPGTFSDGELDEGTAELCATLPFDGTIGGRVLDMGCGAGILGSAVASHAPDASVLMVDVHDSAVASTNATIAANELRNAGCRPSDWYSDVDGRFDAILCNPPFHEGVVTNTNLAREVIERAPAHLTEQGNLWVVANRFLPYFDVLRTSFEDVEVLRDTKRFRVYRAACGRRPDRVQVGVLASHRKGKMRRR